MMALPILVLLGLCPLLTSGSEPVKSIFTNIQPLVGEKAIEEFKKESPVRVLYFYKPEHRSRYKFFLKELDKSVEFVELYNVKICMIDCSIKEHADVSECKEPKTEKSVFAYRGGVMLLQLELETMFDVNSIMSNLLQLVLLREVPIFQSSKEVKSFLTRHKGKQDVIFGYMKAIGTFDHRVFMEVAYAYQGKLKFAICTNMKATQVFEEPPPSSEASTIWWTWTKQMPEEDNFFRSLQYKGALNLAELARFVKYISRPVVFSIPTDGMTHDLDLSDVHLLTFYYKPDRMAEIYNIASLVSKHFTSVIGVVTIDMADGEVQKQYKCSNTLPAVSLTLKGKTEEEFLTGDLHLESIFKFIEERIPLTNNRELAVGEEQVPYEPEEELDNPDDQEHYMEGMEEVEQEDDKVAYSVTMTQKVAPSLDLVPALTDVTFNKTVKAGPITVVLFYFPFTPVNSISLRYFGEAADMLGEQTSVKVVRVSCYDWTDVCQENGILEYPTLRVYKEGKMAWDYAGPKDSQEIFSMLKLLQLSSPRYVTDPKEAMTFIAGQGQTDITKVTNTTVVGLFDEKSSKEMEMFKKVGEGSRDNIMFAYMDTRDSDSVAKQYGRQTPCIILSKFDDDIRPHVTFDGKYTVENIQQFIQENKLPKLSVLTPLMFPALRKQGDSLVVLFMDDSTDSITATDNLREVVKTQTFNNVSFTMLPTLDETSVAYKVLKVYTPEPEVPFLSYINFKKGYVYNFGRPSSDRKSVVQWLGSVVKGTEDPTFQLEGAEWKPVRKGFDFLKMIDMEAEQMKKNKLKNAHRSDEESQQEQVEEVHEDEDVPAAMEDTLEADAREDLMKSRLYNKSPARADKSKAHHDEL